MADLNDWDTTAANNNDAPPDGWPENMNYSEVNNSAREGMAVLARFYNDLNGSLSAGGSADAYTVTLNAGYSAYFDGMMFACTIPAVNGTTTPTINVNGIGAQTILNAAGDAVGVGDLRAGQVFMFLHDGTNPRVLGPVGQQKLAKGADVASATALSLGDDGNYFDITGTTAITSIDTVGVGTIVYLHFDGALTLTHHATDLILPGGANITTAAGDEATFIEYASGDWRCINYQYAAVEPISFYEEGTFSPTILDNSLSDSEGQTYTYQEGHYTRIGNMVVFSLRVTVSSLGTLTTTNNTRIGGLPYTAGGTNIQFPIFVGKVSGVLMGSAGNSIHGYIAAGTAYIELQQADNASQYVAFVLSELTASGDLAVGGQYFI